MRSLYRANKHRNRAEHLEVFLDELELLKLPGLKHHRRAGIEPLIGHMKQSGQLGKSRIKPDETTKSVGYAAVFGFNLRQLTRCLTGEVRLKVDVVNNIATSVRSFSTEHQLAVVVSRAI